MTPQTKSPRWRKISQEITHGTILTSILAFVIALFVGAILIAVANTQVQTTMGYFFSRPADGLSAIWSSVSQAYVSLFKGAVVDLGLPVPLSPLASTLVQAAPLIIGGLGVAIGFRAGVFNIGGNGQIILGAIVCGAVGFGLPLPAGLHPIVAILGAVAGGALWGFVPGILRAKTGANEVIVTIMLNSVAGLLAAWMLRVIPFFQSTPGQPVSPLVASTAQLPSLFGPSAPADYGFVLAVACTIGAWWLLERSTLGFRLRAAGANPDAARAAGIDVRRAGLWALTISGALLGLVAATQLLAAAQPQPLTANIAGTFGFDAITVALLGRSKPFGTLVAGVLFGGLRAGGYLMGTTGTPIDVVLVLESVVVLFIAAPPLVRAIFRLPDPGRQKRTRRKGKKGEKGTVPAEATL